MPRCGWWAAAALVLLAACQSPAPATPTPTVQPPTVTPQPTATLARAASPAAPTPTAQPPTAAPQPPTAAPQPTATAARAASPAAAPPATGASRVEVLNAANAAFRAGDVAMAAGLYERVVNTPPGLSEGGAATTISDFAHFRAMLALLADSREDDARTHLDALQTRDSASALARLGKQLYDQYGMTAQLRGACAQLQPQVASQAGPTLSTLQGLGVTVDAQTLCSVPQI